MKLHFQQTPIIPQYISQRRKITETLNYFKTNDNYLRIKAVILLGCSSGLRAEEIYNLTMEDIDLNKRKITIRHDPKSNHTTKTKKTRISFISEEAKIAIQDYLDYFKYGNNGLRTLFAKKTLERYFRNAPIRVKHLRKYFSQEWDRRGGPTSIKKILMGHSLRGDTYLMHYNAQSEEDLKQIYNKVMNTD